MFGINSCYYSTKFAIFYATSWQKHDIFLQSLGEIRDFILRLFDDIPPDQLWKFNFFFAIANRNALCLRDSLSKFAIFFSRTFADIRDLYRDWLLKFRFSRSFAEIRAFIQQSWAEIRDLPRDHLTIFVIL